MGLSIRAQSYLAASAIRGFCEPRSLEDERVEDFCRYLEELASAEDVVAWDEAGSSLPWTGLGDDGPADPDLAQLLEDAREISAFQIYGAWQPREGAAFLKRVLEASGFDPDGDLDLEPFEEHSPGNHGWGEPVPSNLLEKWRKVLDRWADRARGQQGSLG